MLLAIESEVNSGSLAARSTVSWARRFRAIDWLLVEANVAAAGIALASAAKGPSEDAKSCIYTWKVRELRQWKRGEANISGIRQDAEVILQIGSQTNIQWAYLG